MSRRCEFGCVFCFARDVAERRAQATTTDAFERRIYAKPGAADRQMDLHFRANARLGARDRGAIAETVYACLRRFGLPRHLVGEAGPVANRAWCAGEAVAA